MSSSKHDLNVNQIHIKGIKSLEYSECIFRAERHAYGASASPKMCAESLGVRIPSSLQWLLSDSAGNNIKEEKEILSVPSQQAGEKMAGYEE